LGDGIINFIKNSTTRRKFILSAALSTAVVLFASLVALYVIINTTVREVVYENVIITAQRDKQIYADEIDTWFRTAYDKVGTLAEVLSALSYPQEHRGPGFRDFDARDRDFIEIAERMVRENEDILNVFIGFADGSIINGAGFRPGPGSPWSATDPPWFRAAVEAGEGVIVMTDPYWSNAAEAFTAGIATWLPDLNDVGAVVGVSVTRDDIFSRIAHDPILGDGYRMLVARGGAIIFHSDPWILNDENITTIFDLPEGEFLSENLRERERISSFQGEGEGYFYYVSARLDTVAWTLIDVIPSYAVQDPIAQRLMDILIPIGLLIVAIYIFFILLFIYIAKGRDKEEALALEKETAQASDKAKSRFLARMSHELRTPITSVLGISEIELQNPALPRQMEEPLLRISDSANRVLSIVNNILDLSKLEASKLDLHNERYEVSSLISNVTGLVCSYPTGDDVELVVNVDEKLPKILVGDVLIVEQIVNNLLSNAFKYTPTGSVELSWRHAASTSKEGFADLIVTINDTGYGMTQEQVNTLGKEDYVNLHDDENAFVSGTGLGMSIVHNLLKLVDGTKTIDSKVGKGTKIKVVIPQKLTNTDEIMGAEIAASLERLENCECVAGRKKEVAPRHMPRGRVLVVDDLNANLFVAKGLLALYELQVDTCKSGDEAIEKIKQGAEYDIIFMDIMMPDMDGVQTMNALREMGCKQPIVALTARALIGDAEKFLDSGFDDFLSKPIQKDKMHGVLVKYIKSE